MVIVSEKHRVIGVPDVPAVANMFPSAKKVTWAGNSTIILPHSFAETKYLRSIGFDVPAPVLTQYAWPHEHGKPPFDVQRKTVAMMTTNQRGYVLNGMGTGKTNCLLWAFDFLRSIGQARKLLVVAPLSTLNFTWMRAVFVAFPHLSCTVLHGTKQRRLKRLAEDHDVYIINPDGLIVLKDELVARTDIDAFGLDELATFRNARGAKHKAAKEIAATKVWAWGLTGSPTPTEPTDAYGQCLILTPGTVPRRFSHFRDQTMMKTGPFTYHPKKEAKARVFEVMQPAVRFTLDDVIELPECVERTVDIELGKKQEDVYTKMANEACVMAKEGAIVAANAGAVLNKLLQISIGYVYLQKDGQAGRETISLDNDNRLQRLVDDIEACENKVIVFAPFTHAIDGICTRLEKEGIDVARIDGGTPSKARDNIFNLFQNTQKIRVIVAHPGTMAHGITLTAADTIIWFGPVTSLETFEQANARIRRIGQKRKQQVLMYQGTKAEKKIYAGLRSSQRVQDGILKMFADAQL